MAKRQYDRRTGQKIGEAPSPRQVAIYIRVSKVGEREGKENFYSTDQQKDSIDAEIKRRGYTPAEVFADLNVPGDDPTIRPQFKRALAWVKEDPTSRAIGVYAPDRWGRALGSALSVLKDVYSVGGEVLFSGLGIDVSTDDGETVITMLLLGAQMQRSMISRRWKDTAASRLERSLPTGGPVRFGYRLVPDEPVQQIDPVNGPVLARMYRDYLGGKGSQAIAKWMNEEGVRTHRGNEWTVSSVQRALDSGFGAGMLRMPGDSDVVVRVAQRKLANGDTGPVAIKEDRYEKGKQEPVITPAEWKNYLTERKRRRKLAPKQRTPHWFLAGIARCGLCGDSLFVNSYSAVKSQAICARYKSARSCRGVWINRLYLEGQVGLWLAGNVEELAAQASGRLESRAVATAKADARITAAQDKVDALVTQQKNLLLLAADTDPEVFKVASSETQAKLEAARAEKLEAEEARANVGQSAGPDAYASLMAAVASPEFVATLPEQGAPVLSDGNLPPSLEPSEWNALLRKVIDSIVIEPNSIVITAKTIGRRRPKVATYQRQRLVNHRENSPRGADGRFTTTT